MHNSAFAAMGLDAVYLAFDVAPELLLQVVQSMGLMGFTGVNLTVPLKEVAFGGLENLADSARLARAVNTIKYTDDGMCGYNTDGDGFLMACDEEFGTGVGGLKVCILGTGGSARGVATACAAGGAASVAICGRSPKNMQRLVEELESAFPATPITSALRDGWRESVTAADLVVNTTPIGMQAADTSIVDAEAFRHGQFAMDLIYVYEETVFMQAAGYGGAKTANGLGMLLHQGALALSIWLDTDPPVEAMREALRREIYGT